MRGSLGGAASLPGFEGIVGWQAGIPVPST
jgi:hypothetical protein